MTEETGPLAPLGDGSVGLVIAGETNIQNRDDPVSAFAGVRRALDAGDLRFCHLEGPLCEPSDDPLNPDVPHKLLWRHSDPDMVRALTEAGFHAVSCASNVSYPWQAAQRSAEVLRDAGIAFCGIGNSLEEARSPAVISHGGQSVAFLSYTSVFWPSRHAAEDGRPGTAVLKAYTAYQPGRRALEMPGAPPEIVTYVDDAVIAGLQEDVRAAAARADIVIVSCHWGVSSSPEPVAYQRILGRAAIEAGAKAVIGHHPHVIQPIEYHQGCPIFFSLGNFAFDWPKMRGRNLDGLLLRFDLAGGEIGRIRFVPVMRDADNQIALLDPRDGDGARIVDRLRALCGEDVLLDLRRPDVEISRA